MGVVMIDRYEKVLRDNDPKEIRKLLIEYYEAFKQIQKVDEEELFENDFWLDKSTPLGLFLAMTVDELVNDVYTPCKGK